MTGCSGEIDLSAKNGPVTLEKNSGKLRVDAQNGPVTVSLNGTSWSGSGIEAHANNGPLTLRIPGRLSVRCARGIGRSQPFPLPCQRLLRRAQDLGRRAQKHPIRLWPHDDSSLNGERTNFRQLNATLRSGFLIKLACRQNLWLSDSRFVTVGYFVEVSSARIFLGLFPSPQPPRLDASRVPPSGAGS